MSFFKVSLILTQISLNVYFDNFKLRFIKKFDFYMKI